MMMEKKLGGAVVAAAFFLLLLVHNVAAGHESYYKKYIDQLESLPADVSLVTSGLDSSSKLSEGSTHYHTLHASACTTPLLDRVQGRSGGGTYDDLYEQLYMMVEVWDLGAQKGDALLAMRERSNPQVYFNHESGNWTVSRDTYVDFPSHNLFHRYHRLVVPVDMTKVAQCIRTSTPEACDKSLWYVSLYNAEFWTKQRIEYHIRATCAYAADMPCESTFGPNLEQCNGKGMCVKPNDSVHYNLDNYELMTNTSEILPGKTTKFTNTYNQTLCQCDAFYGNTGCQTTVFELEENKWTSDVGLATDQWRYYRYMAKSSTNSSSLVSRKYLRVELKRTQGDTILFAKNILDGNIVNGLPHLMDYQTLSDKDSFRNRKDYHYIILDDIDKKYENPIYYIAVLNNNAQVKMAARYSIRVQEINVPEHSELGVCGNDCGGIQAGECKRGPDGDKCVCNAAYAGPLCEGHLEKLTPQQTYSGMLGVGEIHYYKMEIASEKSMKHYSMSDGLLGPIKWDLIIEFYKDGGQIVVMGNYKETPTIHENDFVYTFGQHDDNASQENTMLTRPEMEKGTYYLAVFNHNYQNVATPCEYSLKVSLVSNVSLIYGPYIPVVLGVLVAMFLLLLTGVCWRFAMRHTSIGRILFSNNTLGTRSFALDGLGNNTNNRNRNERGGSGNDRGGLSKETIAQLPEVKYTLPLSEEDGEEPICSICLSEFCKDEVLVRLPACNHEFHKGCIEQWLFQHTNCPMCRVEILPEAHPGDDDDGHPRHPHSPASTRSSPEPEEDEEEEEEDYQRNTNARDSRLVAIELQPLANDV